MARGPDRLTLATALPGLALVVGVLAGCTSGASTTAAPTTASPEPTTAAQPYSGPADCPYPDSGGACLGLLPAGAYRTTVFQPRITYAVGDGWINAEDLPGNFWLFRDEDEALQNSERGGSYLGIYQNISAAAIDCTEAAQPDVGTSADELAAWYATVPGLDVSEPAPVTIGGLDGVQIDVSLVPGDKTCMYGPHTGVPLIIGNGVSHLHHVVLEDMDVRLVFLDWNGGNVTLEIANVHEQYDAAGFRDLVQPVLDSLAFAG